MEITPFRAALFVLSTSINLIAMLVGMFLAFAMLVAFLLCITG